MFLLLGLLYVTNSLQSYKVGPIGRGAQVKSRLSVGGFVSGNSRGEEDWAWEGRDYIMDTMDSIISMVEEGMSRKG